LQQTFLLPKTKELGKDGLLLFFNLVLGFDQTPPFCISECRGGHRTLHATTGANAVTATVGTVGAEAHSFETNATFARNHRLKTLVLDPTG
jgi:hypothetical protein